MNTLIAIGLLLAAVVGAFLGHAFTPRRQRQDAKQLPPPPKQTANEVKDDNASGKIDAIKAAADEHDVPASVVADDLEWLDADV